MLPTVKEFSKPFMYCFSSIHQTIIFATPALVLTVTVKICAFSNGLNVFTTRLAFPARFLPDNTAMGLRPAHLIVITVTQAIPLVLVIALMRKWQIASDTNGVILIHPAWFLSCDCYPERSRLYPYCYVIRATAVCVRNWSRNPWKSCIVLRVDCHTETPDCTFLYLLCARESICSCF